MRKYLLLILNVIILQHLTSQVTDENKSFLQLQSEYYKTYGFSSEHDFDKLNPHNPPPQINTSAPGKHIFGWNPYWVGTAYTDYNYNLLTTVAYFSYEVDTATGSYADIHFWRTTNLVPLAHQNNVKVVLTVTNFGSANNTKILSSPQKRQRLIDSVISLVQFRQADGVNIDFELVPGSQKTNLTAFMTALSLQMHAAIPNSKISICLPAVDWNNSFDVPALNTVCDYMIIMGYDYYWSTAPNAGPCAPLQSGSVWTPYNVTNSVNNYLSAGASTAKLMLGVPYYGYRWPTQTGNLNSPTTGSGTALVYSSMKTNAATYGRLWDANSFTPWFKYQSGSWYQGWYDDSVSLGLKYDFVNTKNLAGIGIWALSYDGQNTELWNTILNKFGLSGIHITGNEIPDKFELYQNYPNPFNPITKIKFAIPVGNPAKRDDRSMLKIYDAIGREIETLVNEELNPGTYEAEWNASAYPSGVYFYKLTAREYSQTKRMILVK